MDRLGGQTALAISSLGVTNGYTNGLKGMDGFQTGGRLNPRGGGGGNNRAVFVFGLDRRVTVNEMKTLFIASATARSVYGCRDTGCYSNIDAMRLKAERSARLKKAPEDFLKKAEKATTRLTRIKTALEQSTQWIGHIPFAPKASLPASITPVLDKRVDGYSKIGRYLI